MKTHSHKSPRLPALLAGLVLAGSALLWSSGCVAVVAAGAAGTGVAWYAGRMETTLNEGVGDVYDACRKAVDQLEFARVSERKSGVDGELVARTALDKKVTITLNRVDDHVTKLSIRVGVFGDEALSLNILEKIKAHL